MLDNDIVKATGDKLAAGRAAAAKMPARPVSQTPIKKAPAAKGGWSDRNPTATPGAGFLSAVKGAFSGKGGLGDKKRPAAALAKKKSSAR